MGMDTIKRWLGLQPRLTGGEVQAEVYKDVGGEYRWRFVRGGNVVADSAEGYTRKRDCVRAVNSLLAALWSYGSGSKL
jgi:uncharacterized protein YegP (UPF0339 family)